MKIPDHYLVLKPFLDQTVFSCGDVDNYFRTTDKLKFSDQFVDYHAHFLDNRKDSHLLLLSHLSEYCKEIGASEREKIVKVVLENELIANTTAFAVCLNDGRIPDREQYTVTLLRGLQKFVEDGRLNAQMEYFFSIFFRNFEDLDPRKYAKSEVTKSEYEDLIAKHLKYQTDFSIT